MLSERERNLVTAFVDGELSTRQRRYVVRLLHRSREARRLLRKLQLDSTQLRQLEPPALTVDLSGAVLQEIARRELAPVRRKALVELASATAQVPVWFGLASAAAVLLVVGASSYFFFITTPRNGEAPAQAVAQDHSREDAPQARKKDATGEVGPVVELPWEDPDPDPLELPAPPDPGPNPGVVVKEPAEPSVPPERAPVRDDPRPGGSILADKPREELELKVVDTLPPTLVGLHELEEGGQQEDVRGLLQKGKGFRIEIPCKDGSQTLRMLQQVCKKQDIGLILEPFARTRLTRTQWRTSYLLYVDTLTPEEMTALLAGLGSADRAISQRRPSERQTTQAVVTPLSRLDVRELVDHTGMDLTQAAAPGMRGPLGTDLKKPLSEQTAEDVARALEGKRAKEEASPDEGKEPAHLALAMVYNLARISPPTAEVQRFLDRQKQARPGAVRILLILRAVG